nr:fibroin heavy chain-like [Leptinotarsa decemlineata]
MAVTVYLVLAFVGATWAFSGQYIPKSFYVIDHEGHRSDVVPIRTRRDILKPLLRFRRGYGAGGGSGASASSHASAGSSAGAGGGVPYFGDFDPGLVFPDFTNFAQNFPAGFGGGSGGAKGGAHSFASSSSSSSSGTGSGYGNQGHAGGLGAGQGVGGRGPVLFSRFGEDKGTGVEVSGAAQGPQGAFSASSSSIDSEGNIKYSVQSGKH